MRCPLTQRRASERLRRGQLHVLLKRGMDELTKFFPGLDVELERAGAVPVRTGSAMMIELPGFDPFPRRDLGFDQLCMTRPLVEWVVRRFVQQQASITVRSGCRVTRMLASESSGTVVGVCCDMPGAPNQQIEADFVVDASSRGTVTLELLDRLGMPRPDEDEIGADIGYATGMFEIPNQYPRDWLGVIHFTASRRRRTWMTSGPF